MTRQPTFVTQEGHEKLEAELDFFLTTRRKEVAKRLHQTLTEGDILENAELEAARNEQAFVEGRILALEKMLGTAVIINSSDNAHGTVGLGSTVTIAEDDEPSETYFVVGSAEADPANGHISNESPLGRALLGKKVGDMAVVHAPAGILAFKIIKIL